MTYPFSSQKRVLKCLLSLISDEIGVNVQLGSQAGLAPGDAVGLAQGDDGDFLFTIYSGSFNFFTCYFNLNIWYFKCYISSC